MENVGHLFRDNLQELLDNDRDALVPQQPTDHPEVGRPNEAGVLAVDGAEWRCQRLQHNQTLIRLWCKTIQFK